MLLVDSHGGAGSRGQGPFPQVQEYFSVTVLVRSDQAITVPNLLPPSGEYNLTLTASYKLTEASVAFQRTLKGISSSRHPPSLGSDGV